MPDVVADVLAEWRVVPENVVLLSVFAFGCRGGFVVEGVLICAFVKLQRLLTREVYYNP